MSWSTLLALDRNRAICRGSPDQLASAIRRGADLRIYTEFYFNEHVDTNSDNTELVREVADFRVTYLLEDRWTAGIINLRQPIQLPDRFGPRPSMSFFLYNQDAQQAIARPYLDGRNPPPHAGMEENPTKVKKNHFQQAWDIGTNAPSSQFIYDFEVYRFNVLDQWQQVYAHDATGRGTSGTLDDLVEAFALGCEVKVAISGLCDDLSRPPGESIGHEVFVHCGSCYYGTDGKLFIAGTHPLVRVKPAIPLMYSTGGWDFGWLMVRTDGFVARRLCDPYTLKFRDDDKRYDIRWFVR